MTQMTDTAFATKLAAMDLTSVIARVKDHTGMTDADIAKAEDLYRKFLQLAHHYRGKQRLVPPALADVIWDAHVTDTKKYMADCYAVFGDMFHHDPSFYQTPEYTPAKRRTVDLYQQHYGYDLPALTRIESGEVPMGFCGGGQ
ncbi:MAG: hypothetical protein WAX89_02015 [Alphaproteobacteria bacterium]